jgi:predicted acetyltransferase
VTIPYRKFSSGDGAFHDELMRQAFGTGAVRNAELRARTGETSIRIVELDGAPAGALTPHGCGQVFGGAAVSTALVAGVAVAPCWRGRGVGGSMLAALLRELNEEGVTLCTLYASNMPLYRKVGFEVAGSRCLYDVELASLAGTRPRGAELVRLPLDDLDPSQPLPASLRPVEESYRHAAIASAGLLDRTAFFWREKLAPPARDVDLYLLGEHGYVAARHAKGDLLEVMDWCVDGPEGQALLLWFLAGQRANWKTARLYGSPFEPLSLDVRDGGWSLASLTPWLIRIVDVQRALASRAYPAGLTGTLSLAVEDPLLEANRSGFRLTLEHGKGIVERCAAAECQVQVDIGALAPLYTGHATPGQLARAGRLSGDAASLAWAVAAFAGPPPYLMDTF